MQATAHRPVALPSTADQYMSEGSVTADFIVMSGGHSTVTEAIEGGTGFFLSYKLPIRTTFVVPVIHSKSGAETL